MIQYCWNTGCFVVGVGKRGSFNEVFEWRISTSLPERYLMLNLDITQIRCYVLMKMILKTFIPKRFSDIISSFICKTVLLHCISYTRFDAWKVNIILICLSLCLSKLYNCVQNEYCPNFFITQNNLMSGRFSPEMKPLILKTLRKVIESNRRALLQIKCDNFGLYFQSSLNGFPSINAHFISTRIAGGLLTDTAHFVSKCAIILLRESRRHTMQKLLTFMSNYHYDNFTNIYRKAFILITRYLCSTFGSIQASSNIYQHDYFTYQNALKFMSLGLDSDVSSGKLKLASVFYCTGDNERTEFILKNIEESYDLSIVEPACLCYSFNKGARRERFNRLCYESNEEWQLLKQITASCVRFIRCEINCCPLELQHEMFRSTQEDLAYRSENDEWMDMAVEDSLPYLYFLQYKTYSRLGRQDDKQRALSNIARTIDVEPNLGHRETAQNILGQCMEQENNLENAFKCYVRSLQIRGQNNSAKFHICRLLNKLINN
jgi:tetratricopeptide (TPR) repeat protein